MFGHLGFWGFGVAANIKPVNWEDHGAKLTPEEVVVDGRSASLKAKSRQSENMNTLTTNYEMWQDRPKSIFIYKMQKEYDWFQSCTILHEQGQIMHAV